jgi:NADPH-dependent ferric siderophore reductase
MAETPVRRAPAATRLTVVRTEPLTPHMVRVVLGGDQFDRFADNGCTDRYVKLVFPRPGVTYPAPLDMAEIRRTLPPDQWPRVRTYTVRRYDPVRRQLAIDFVLHGDRGVAGPWAAAAQPGDELTLLGPGGAYAPRADVDGHLLVGDEAALPAIGSALEAMPAGVPVRVLVEVAGPAEQQPLPSPGDVSLTWLHRDDPGASLVTAVRDLTLPRGTVQAFVHGELAAMRELRPHLVDDRAIPADLLSLSGYWRRGKDEDGFQAEKAEDARRTRARAEAPAPSAS